MPKYPEPTIELRRLGRRVIEANFEGGDREQALYAAYCEGGITMTALAREADLSVTHVGRLIRKIQGVTRYSIATTFSKASMQFCFWSFSSLTRRPPMSMRPVGML